MHGDFHGIPRCAVERVLTAGNPGEPLALVRGAVLFGGDSFQYLHGNGQFFIRHLAGHVHKGTPVYAAVEILLYGFAWLLSRHHRDSLGYSRNTSTLLDGQEVGLCVLAPRGFYRSFDRAAFEMGIDAAVRSIAAPFGATMSFLFLEFDLPGPASEDADLRSLLDDRFPG